MVKILHGTKGELLLDVVWHPVRPIIASISSGLVSIWAQNQVENWSAFAPDFKELDENVEYEERESEFDITDEDKSVDLNAESKNDEELEVDVLKIEPVAAFCSSDEEGEDETALQFLPMAPEVEDPEDGWATQDSGEPNIAKESSELTTATTATAALSIVTATSKEYDDTTATEVAAKKRKTNNYDISLPDAPIDGECKIEIATRIYNMLHFSLETHPLISSKTNKDKQPVGGKKSAGRPKK